MVEPFRVQNAGTLPKPNSQLAPEKMAPQKGKDRVATLHFQWRLL